jgi:hypothetical protein
LYLGCFPQRSTAALAALRAMSFNPVAPFSDPSFHLLVRNETALFDIAFGLAKGGQKSNFVCDVAIVDIVG